MSEQPEMTSYGPAFSKATVAREKSKKAKTRKGN
jgi:hypothetical protein